MAKYITEVLREINDNPELFKTTYKKFGDGGPLGVMFKHAFLPEWKFKLPSGDPPFKPAPEPLGMTPSRFINEIRKFSHFCRTDLKSTKLEMMYVQMLEGIHPDEAKIVNAIKDQKLTELYPNITYKAAAEAGFVPYRAELDVVVEQSKKEVGVRRGRPPKKQSPQVAA